jgi:hypothetical protein
MLINYLVFTANAEINVTLLIKNQLLFSLSVPSKSSAFISRCDYVTVKNKHLIKNK